MRQILPKPAILAACAALLSLPSCGPSGQSLTDVFQDMAELAVVVDRQAMDNASLAVDESSVASESGGTKSILVGSPASRVLVQATVVVVHSDPDFALTGKTAATLAKDVVTVTRSWTAADGGLVTDITVRPEIPGQGGFYSSPVTTYAPNVETGADLVWNPGDSSYTLTGSSVRQVDGVVVSSTTMTLRYAWNGDDGRAALLSVAKEGEAVSLLRGDVRLDTSIYYAYDSVAGEDREYLRTIDWVTGGGILKRETIAFGLTDLTALLVPAAAGTWSGQVQYLPGLDTVLSGASSTSLDLLYWTDPSVASYALEPSDPSTFPVIDASRWIRAVTSPASPRDVHVFRPTAEGSFARRLEIVKNGAAIATTTYSLADGTTVLGTGSATRLVTAADGAVTTHWTFADGKARSVTILPTEDGYRITRSTATLSQTYEVSYARDAAGELVSVTVTNSETGTSTTYVEAEDGTWRQA